MLKYNLYVLTESTAILFLNRKSIYCLHLNSIYISLRVRINGNI